MVTDVNANKFSRAQTVRAMDALSATMTIDRPDGSEQRRSKIVPAARWATIDYRSIVANAVAGLANNTPDARCDVYAQARGVVHRHLQLMRLPEPIIELEKLALDLTIRKIEWQTRAERAAPEKELAAVEEETEPTVHHAARSFGTAAGEVARAFTSLMIVLGLRPVLWIAASPLRFIARAIFSPVGLAAGLPITALLVTTFYLLDTNTGFESAVGVRTAQFLDHVDAWLNGSAPPVAGENEAQVASTIEPPASVGTAPARAVPARARVTASSRGRSGVYAPSSPGQYDRALARPPAPLAALSPAPTHEQTPTRLPKWFSGYADVLKAAPTASAAIDGASTSNSLSGTADVSEAAPTSLATIDGAPEAPPAEPEAAPYAVAAANSLAAIPDDRAAVAVTLPPLRTPAPKVAALIEAGKKAATAGHLEKAARDFGEAVRIDPIYPGGYTERGHALFRLGETDRAIADFSAAIKRDPNYGPALRGRAMANLYRGATELALADLSKAILLAEIDPNRLSPLELLYARRSRANIYRNKMQYDREIADCAIIEAYKRDKVLGTALVGVNQTGCGLGIGK
jgi:tetratricopeptide (TPR) repeat protein